MNPSPKFRFTEKPLLTPSENSQIYKDLTATGVKELDTSGFVLSPSSRKVLTDLLQASIKDKLLFNAVQFKGTKDDFINALNYLEQRVSTFAYLIELDNVNTPDKES